MTGGDYESMSDEPATKNTIGGKSNINMRSRTDVHDVPGVTDLPDPLLECVAKYLAHPSQAMFAVALRAPSSSWCNRKSQQEPSASNWLCELGKWDVLDFDDIDKNLASKLDDDDVGAMLMSIDANNNVERLKLAGLVNITGKGLESICGSTKLKQIDLSLVGQHEPPLLECPGRLQTKISDAIVVPILGSIVNRIGSSLRQLQLPNKWCGYRNRGIEMNHLLQQYSTLLDQSRFDCAGGTHETGECFGTDGEDWFTSYALQGFTCYECLENICNDPAVDVAVHFCERCQKSYCQECMTIDAVSYCSKCI